MNHYKQIQSAIVRFAVTLTCIFSFHLSLAQNKEIDSLKNLLNEQIKDTTQVKILLRLSSKYAESDLDKLALYAHKALLMSHEIEYSFGVADANRFLGVHEYRKGNLDSAETLFRNSYDQFEKLKLRKEQSKLYYQIALISFRKSNYEEAIKRFNKLVDFNELHNDDNGKSKAYLLLGIIYNDLGNPVKAVDYYQKSLTIELDQGNTNIQSMLYNNLSTLFYSLDEKEKSLEYLKKSLALIDSTEYTLHRANVIRNIGETKWDLGFYKDALQDFRAGHEILIKINEVCYQSEILNSIGGYYVQFEQYDSAFYYLQKSLKIATDCDAQEELTKALIALGSVYEETQRDKEAIDTYTKGYDLADKLKLLVPKKSAALYLYQIYKRRGNNKSAIYFLEEYHSAQDQIINEKNTKEIIRLESEFEFEKEKAVLLLEQEKQELSFQNDLKEERLIKYLSFTTLFFVSLLAFILYRYYQSKSQDNIRLSEQNKLITKQSEELLASSNKEKQLLNDQIRFKEKELATMAMQANEKSNLLSNLEVTLESMRIEKDNQAQFKQIKSIIANNIKKEDSWNSFLHRFEDIYPNFFEHLKSQFESLSLNELKLCGYIKIGMSNHEIMQVANVANSTVKKNLNRLKKKLLLGPEDSIRDFLIKYT